MNLLHKALVKAVALHAGQDRDGEHPLPYACHPAEVVWLLRWQAGVTDEEELAAAFLHDAIEETSASLSEIEFEFGSRVGSLVRELTRCEPTPDETKGMNKEQVYALRNSIYMAEIEAMTPAAQRIKLCDRLSNLREARLTRSQERLKRYVDQSRRILEIIPSSVCPPVWERIHKLVMELS